MRALPCFAGKIIFRLFSISLYTVILCAFEFLKESSLCQNAVNTKAKCNKLVDPSIFYLIPFSSFNDRQFQPEPKVRLLFSGVDLNC